MEMAIILIIILLIPVFYVYTLSKNTEDVEYIKDEKKCPKCNSEDITIFSTRNGCSGTETIDFKCNECEYKNVFTINSGNASCGI